LENFWKSVIEKPDAPNPRKYRGNKVIDSPAPYRSKFLCTFRHASTDTSKDYEIQNTMEMSKMGAAKWRDSTDVGDEQDGQALSDTSDSCELLIKSIESYSHYQPARNLSKQK